VEILWCRLIGRNQGCRRGEVVGGGFVPGVECPQSIGDPRQVSGSVL
jgi:hypothetical protein